MVSFRLNLISLDRQDPKYWYTLLQSLSNTKAFYESLSEEQADKSSIDSMVDYLKCEIDNILKTIPLNDIFVSSEMDPTVVIEENGTVIEMTLDEYIAVAFPRTSEHLLN